MGINDDWYYNGEGKSEWGFDALADFDAAERVEAQVFVEKFRQDAPPEFEYSEPDEDNPFGSWERKDDQFGGTFVSLLPAAPPDSIADREYPVGLAMWVHAGEGLELGHLTPGWPEVDQAIQDYIDHWDAIEGDES